MGDSRRAAAEAEEDARYARDLEAIEKICKRLKTDVDFLNMMRRFRETATTLPLQLHQHRQIDDLMKRFFEEKK